MRTNVKILNCGTTEEQIHFDNMNIRRHVYSDGLSTSVEVVPLILNKKKEFLVSFPSEGRKISHIADTKNAT